MSIETEVLVRKHEQRLNAFETRLQLLEDENKLLRAALDNRGPVKSTLTLKGRAS